jgi:clan AA aspartic protease
MGNVIAEITIKNSGDIRGVDRGLIPDNEVRTVTLNALVDTRAMTLVINEDICQKLGLRFHRTKKVTLADGKKAIYQVTEPVQIWWKDRYTIVHAYAHPGIRKTLLGVIPLEDMDLFVDHKHNKLTRALSDIEMGQLY